MKQILIGRRTVRIGHQVYPLASIGRVCVEWRGELARFRPLREIALLLLLIGAIVVAGVAQPVLAAIAVVGGARVLWLLRVLRHRLVRRPYHTLVIEAGGTRYAVLSGTGQAEIDRIRWEILDALENPPSQDRVVWLNGDVVFGNRDQRVVGLLG